MVTKLGILKGIVVVNAFLIAAFVLLLSTASAQEAQRGLEMVSLGDGIKKAGLAIGAGVAAGAAAAGAGIGVGTAGSAALGAIAEKKEMLTWSLVFVALAEGVALYGLAVAFIMIGKL